LTLVPSARDDPEDFANLCSARSSVIGALAGPSGIAFSPAIGSSALPGPSADAVLPGPSVSAPLTGPCEDVDAGQHSAKARRLAREELRTLAEIADDQHLAVMSAPLIVRIGDESFEQAVCVLLFSSHRSLLYSILHL
jgi:hypothetical protein